MKIAPHFSVGLRFKRRIRPEGTIETHTSGAQCEFMSARCRQSSLPGRIALKNANPALKCWATFIASLPGRGASFIYRHPAMKWGATSIGRCGTSPEASAI
jgi:hypothetical protein